MTMCCQSRSRTCRQIALALRDEVQDLESAGIGIIQIDEPALREGLPLRRADWKAYLAWAVECFRITASGVRDDTQIHTHMCYSEFNDIIEAVAAMDADVISIETSRSRMELLDAFVKFHYPNQIGPGVYDIHSPRVPDSREMLELLEKAEAMLTPEQIPIAASRRGVGRKRAPGWKPWSLLRAACENVRLLWRSHSFARRRFRKEKGRSCLRPFFLYGV